MVPMCLGYSKLFSKTFAGKLQKGQARQLLCFSSRSPTTGPLLICAQSVALPHLVPPPPPFVGALVALDKGFGKRGKLNVRTCSVLKVCRMVS